MTQAPLEFTNAYIAAALWLSCQDDESEHEFLDVEYSICDLSPCAKERVKSDCNAFYAKNAPLIGKNADQAGHDFWLTRNGHGAGFWDRVEIYGKDASLTLSNSASEFKGASLYGYEGRVYHD